ncbi:hypothetical protein NHX12_004676 [Muraenolepis orangiensis]|uniref:Uncharacterized protein n=1 Tax=Muraenolepis orangiensis TaxID=630683 RepID=A0A9Q0DVP1_9TELE|nr:hypothetical protein NHX12_004676 [Muraenolepis orangiensis]
MSSSRLLRSSVVFFSVVCFLATLVMNGLSGAGKGPFGSSVGNISSQYETDLTPAGWTFSIWGLIYTWLSLLLIYTSCYLLRGPWACCLLPSGFYVCWVVNMLMNITWLLLWDRQAMEAALVVLAMVTLSNYGALFFCCYATEYYGLWLQNHQPRDLACLRILVQNGLALYSTWTSVATLINLCVVLELWGVARTTAGTASLCILLGQLLAWFFLENVVLSRWVSSLQTVYPVVVLALLGTVVRHYDPAEPTTNSLFQVVLLVLSCVLLVSRVAMAIYRARKHPPLGLDQQPIRSPCDEGKSKLLN